MDQNRAVFEELGFIPRVMRDVSNVDIQVDLWGQTYATPFGIAPMGLSALTAYQGDLVQARAAHRFNVPMIMSGSSLTRLEQVPVVGKHVWFQAYLPGRKDQSEALVARLQADGYAKHGMTVITPRAAKPDNNLPPGKHLPT